MLIMTDCVVGKIALTSTSNNGLKLHNPVHALHLLCIEKNVRVIQIQETVKLPGALHPPVQFHKDLPAAVQTKLFGQFVLVHKRGWHHTV